MGKVIKPKLKHAQFHLTNKCNLDCLFCWCHHNKTEYKDVNPETLLAYLKEACKMTPEVITLSGGGEPLCRRDLTIQMMRTIKTDYLEISGVLITNATLIDKDLAEELVSLNWDDVIISMQGPNPRINDSIVGLNGAFDKTVNGIRLIKQAKNKQCKEKPLLTIKTVVTKYNYEYIIDMIEFSDKLGVDNIEFRLVNEEGGKNLSIPDSEFLKFITFIKKAKKDYKNLNVKFEFDIEDLKFKNEQGHNNTNNALERICLVPFTELVIFGNGTMSVCCNYFKDQFKTDSEMVVKIPKNGIKKAWHEGFQKRREDLQNKKLPLICQRCSQDMAYHNNKDR